MEIIEVYMISKKKRIKPKIIFYKKWFLEFGECLAENNQKNR